MTVPDRTPRDVLMLWKVVAAFVLLLIVVAAVLAASGARVTFADPDRVCANMSEERRLAHVAAAYEYDKRGVVTDLSGPWGTWGTDPGGGPFTSDPQIGVSHILMLAHEPCTDLGLPPR